jgi:hypothetical protein
VSAASESLSRKNKGTDAALSVFLSIIDRFALVIRAHTFAILTSSKKGGLGT